MSGKKIWALKTVAMILSIYYGFWIILGIVLGNFEISGASALIENFIDAMIILLLLRAVERSYSITVSEMTITFQLPWKNFSLGLLVGVTFWLGAGIISETLRPVLPLWTIVPKEYNFVTQYANSQGLLKVALFFAVGFITPVIEEVLYRGLIYSILRRGFFVPATLILSSGIFGLVHVYPELVVISFLIGCGLAWLRERGKSLVCPIVAHTTINCFSLLFSGCYHG